MPRVVQNRAIHRAKSRLLVRFGTAAADKTAFSKNISETGVFLRTNQVCPPGTTLHVEIQFPDRSFSFWGRVMWAKRVPPQLAHLLDCGMGVRFIDPSSEWLEYYKVWKKRFGVP